jgi:hypothetical protein
MTVSFMDSPVGMLQLLLQLVRHGFQIMYSCYTGQYSYCGVICLLLSLQVLKMCGMMIDVGKSYVTQQR